MILGLKHFSKKEFKKDCFFKWTVYLFVFTLPLWRSINTILIWPMVLCWLLTFDFKIRIENFLKNKFSFLYIFLLFSLFLIGLFFSDNLKGNLKDVEQTITLLLFPIMILSTKPVFFNLKKIIIALGLGLLLGMVICWSHVIVDIFSKADPAKQAKYFFQWIYSDAKLLSPLGVHPSYFAVMLVFFISNLCFNKDFFFFRKRTFLFVITLSLFFLFLLETSSRIAFILFVIVLLYNMFKIKNIKHKLICVSTIIVMMLLSIKFDYLSTKFGKILDSSGHVGFERVHRWKAILDVFLESKDVFLGTGSGDVDEIYMEAYKRGNFQLALNDRYNAHNQYLEFFVSNGLLGFFVYLVVLVYFLYSTRLKSDYHVYFIIIILLFSVTESIFGTSKGVFFFSFFYCVLISKFRNE